MQSQLLRLAFAAMGTGGLLCFSAAGAIIFPTRAIGTALARGAETNKGPSTELARKAHEIKMLSGQAASVTKKIDALADAGSLPITDGGMAAVQELIGELKKTNQALAKVQQDVAGILARLDAKDADLKPMQTDLARLKKVTQSNFIQFQWQHMDGDPAQGPRQNGFMMRRMEFGQVNRIDDKTSMKLNFDVATGNNRTSAELKDAVLFYDLTPDAGVQAAMGQQRIPLGNELPRSSSELEFPERSIYNVALFNGERDRGVNLKYAFGKGMMAHVGIWNGMTVNDPQQSARGFGDVDSKVGFTAGIRARGRNYDVGIATLQAQRPGFVPTVNPAQVVPTTQRSLLFLDGLLSTKQLVFRGEFMLGKDRPPTGDTSNPVFRRQTDVLGWQAQLTYALNPVNQLHVRYQAFDPDTTNSSLDNQHGLGYAYTHWFNPGVKVTLSYEVFYENPPVRNNVWTIRSQFKL